MQKVNQSEQELEVEQVEQDFSKPWEHSDAILLVEGQQFHVHRAILAMSSPVFSRMFSADFKEKRADEIPLPDKKADEIKGMLLTIYPSSWKPINKNNCYFLLALAQEYQMTKLTEKCEDFLLQALELQPGADVLETIVVAQSYNLERVISKCINKTQSISIQALVSHGMYQKIEPLTQRKIIELQMHKVEKEVSKMQDLAVTAMVDCIKVISMLGSHIRHANQAKPTKPTKPTKPSILVTLKNNMEIIEKDKVGDEGRTGVCQSLSSVSHHLRNLHESLMKMVPSSRLANKGIFDYEI